METASLPVGKNSRAAGQLSRHGSVLPAAAEHAQAGTVRPAGSPSRARQLKSPHQHSSERLNPATTPGEGKPRLQP